jgi:hypothetical protein
MKGSVLGCCCVAQQCLSPCDLTVQDMLSAINRQGLDYTCTVSYFTSDLHVFCYLKKAVKGQRFGVPEDMKMVRYSGSAGAHEVLCGGNVLANVSVGCLHQCPWLIFLTLCLYPELCRNRFHLNIIR